MPVCTRVEGTPAPVDRRRLAIDARKLLRAVGLPDAEWSIVLADDAFVRPLNAQWRGIDAPTDVLSFPQDEHTVLGDVVISIDTAVRQAAERGHDLPTELRVLLVHGLLHLLGHDHEQGAGEAARMAAEEERLLAVLGLAREAALVSRAG